MRFCITANPKIKGTVDVTRRVTQHLESRGEEVVLEKEIANFLRKGGGIHLEDLGREIKVHVLITIGGDGTVLRALQKCTAPILGINMGHLGFLNEVEPEEATTALDRVIEGDYHLEIHNRLRVFVDGESMPPALNEAVIHTSQIAKMREFSITVDGYDMEQFRADALIVATPTGSTGYSFSAGGPLLDPRVDGMIILPLAPFRMFRGPSVVPLKSVVKIEILNKRSCLLVIDGQTECRLKGDETIEITKAAVPAEFIRFTRDPFASRKRAFRKMRP